MHLESSWCISLLYWSRVIVSLVQGQFFFHSFDFIQFLCPAPLLLMLLSCTWSFWYKEACPRGVDLHPSGNWLVLPCLVDWSSLLSMSTPTIKFTPCHIISHNTQWFNSHIKHCKAFLYHHSHQADMLLLQEIHFPASYRPTFPHKHYPVLHLANAPDKTNGVAIYFAKQVFFMLLHEFRDLKGQFLLVKGLVGKQLCSFISYVPTRSNFFLFHNVPHLITTPGEYDYLWGDPNIALDLCLNKFNPAKAQCKSPPKSSTWSCNTPHTHALTMFLFHLLRCPSFIKSLL